MEPEIDFFPGEDAIVVKLADSPVVTIRSIDGNRIYLDLDQEHNVIGITFMDVSHGINLAALPQELLTDDTGPGQAEGNAPH